jgi:uracil-DNA glycosylase
MTLFKDQSGQDQTVVERVMALNAEMKNCTRCDLAIGRTQVVTGEGNPQARVMLIGHGPGGADDASGHPYSGPGGELLNELLHEVGINRADMYISNLTRCWAWRNDGDRRVNRTPTAKEIKACTPVWLKTELALIRPKALVCLGGQAAQYVLGKDFKITQSRGVWMSIPPSAPFAIPTGSLPEPTPMALAILQPAYLIHLAEHSPEAFTAARQSMISDLLKVRRVIEGEVPGGPIPQENTTRTAEDTIPRSLIGS